MAKNELKNQKENNKNKRSFFKDFKAELKRVSWPTPKQLVNNTVAVITIVLLTAAIVFVLDVVFEAINTQGINKVKQLINTENSTSEENQSSNEGNSEENGENAENTEATEESTENTETPVEENTEVTE